MGALLSLKRTWRGSDSSRMTESPEQSSAPFSDLKLLHESVIQYNCYYSIVTPLGKSCEAQFDLSAAAIARFGRSQWKLFYVG